MIPYILHVTLITTICFLFYKLLLQKETFYRLNRWTLMGCLAVSFGLPLLPVPREWSWRDKWAEKVVVREPVIREKQVDRSAQPAAPPLVAVQPVSPATAGSTDSKRAITGSAASTSITFKSTTHRHTEVNTHKLTTIKESHRTDKTNQAASETLLLPLQTYTSAGPTKDQTTTHTHESKTATTTTGTPVRKDVTGTPVAAFSGSTLFLIAQWLFYVYLLGVLLFGANFLMQLGALLYQSYSRPVIRDGRYRIVEVAGNRAPCSFGNTIFINPEIYDWETYNQILIHEKIHVSGRHTLDIILAEMALVIQWFNPFAWLYRREVENNLEFLTDADVLLHREVERSAYQLSLLRVSAPHLPFSLTNNYNQSLLKRRIVMMNSKRSSLNTVWKYFFLIPLLTGLVCALNKPVAALGAIRQSAAGAGPGHTPRKSGSPANGTNGWGTASADTTKHPAKAAKDSAKDNSSSSDDSWYDNDRYSATQEAYQRAAAAMDQLTLNYNLSLNVQTQTNVDLKQQELQARLAQIDILKQKLNLSKDQVDMLKQAGNISQAQLDALNQNGALSQAQLDLVNQKLNLSKTQLDALNQATNIDQMRVDLSNQVTNMKMAMDQAQTVQPQLGNIQVQLQNIQTQPLELNLRLDIPPMTIINDSDLLDGSWFATSYDDYILFELRSGNDDNSYHSSFRVNKSEINPFPGQGNVAFKLVRDAGTLSFNGQFDGQEGFGHFHYDPNASYLAALKQMGVEEVEERRQFGMFELNIKKDYVNMIVHNGYPHIRLRDLVSFGALHIDQEFIQYWRATGLIDNDDTHNLISLKAQRVDRAYVEELKAAGYDHLTVHELESMRAMHVDRAYIRSVGRGKDNELIPVRELVNMKAMHVDSAYMEGLKKIGYTNLSPREIDNLSAMHVTPEFIKQMQDLGFKDLSARDLSNLKAMKVTPEYVKSLRDIGYKNIAPRDLSNLRAMNIDAAFIKGFQDIGLNDISTGQLSNLKAVNVTPEFVKGFTDLGYADLTANQLSQLRVMNITPDFVREFNKIGFDHIPVNLLTSMKATGLSADYVKKMKDKGFDSNDLKKYIRLKNDFN